mmetsp:Transcript_1187/g.2594  ORF Transcript_1187/g.2594 Transcript_1187/m.2594 type:complete len:274 (-) Transcript_1187:81-902(-)
MPRGCQIGGTWPKLWILALILEQLVWLAAAEGLGSTSLRSRRSAVSSENPLLDNYRRMAVAYEKDAQEAEVAAEKYSYMTQAALGGAVKQAVNTEMERLHVRPWANAVWQFERMLRDPRPANAAAKASEAAAPYEKEFNVYVDRQHKFDAAAQQYALRVRADGELAKNLATYSNQYRLEGDSEKADEFKVQAQTLMNQVASEQSLAKQYHAMAQQIFKKLPDIQKMAGQAAEYAAWKENPAGALPTAQLLPFTVAPPLDLAATGDVSVAPPVR